MKVHIINSGLGNINSISKCVGSLGYDYEIIDNPKNLISSDKIIFPGVGSFSAAMQKIIKFGYFGLLLHNLD